MFTQIESYFDVLRSRRMHGQREKVTLIWCDKNGDILVDSNGMIFASEVWRYA